MLKGKLKDSDWLIVAGVVLLPLGFSILCVIGYIISASRVDPITGTAEGANSDALVFSILSLMVAVAAGLITTGILLRRNK
jgi:hypothetical protein